MSVATALLFDLDGTLTDNFAGITRSIQHALAAMGAVPPPESALRSCVGPPLRQSLAVPRQTRRGCRYLSLIHI